MSKLLIGLMALGSISAHANQYFKVDFDCRARLDTRSLDQIRPIVFPTVPFKIHAIIEHSTSKVYRTEVIGLDEIGTPTLTRSLDEEYSTTSGWKMFNKINIQFPEVSRKETDNFLLKLGIPSPRQMNRKLKFGQLEVMSRGPNDLSGISTQIDFSDGEAYHVAVMCYFEDDSMNELGVQTWRGSYLWNKKPVEEEYFDFKRLKIIRN